MKPKLGTLERLDVRDIWQSESSDFTPWLAQEENLARLSEEIGIELELEATERNVGPFRADILCKDTENGNWVLIENQLGRTDHCHLGQLLTYAAGLQAVTIVWIAQPFTDEHRAALDWLNGITNDQFNFFGLEVEVWRIGDSEPAPKFNVISKPNDWSISIKRAATQISESDLTETKQKNLEFWRLLSDLLEKGKSEVRSKKPRAQHWMNFSIGRSGFHLSAVLNSREKNIGVQVYISHDNAKMLFEHLKRHKMEIEEKLGYTLSWEGLPNRKACRVGYKKPNCDPRDEDQWQSHLEWFKSTLEKFNNVFRPYIRELNTDDWPQNTEEHESQNVA